VANAYLGPDRRHALFDLDGTLTDPRIGILRCIHHALDHLDFPAPLDAELETWIGPPLYDSFFKLLRTPELAAEALNSYRERFARIGLIENAPYPGITECLQRIQNDCDSIYVVTSKPTLFARPILEHFSLRHYFDGVYGSHLDGSMTDKAALIAHVLQVEALEPRATIMIGDRKHDVIGAKANAVRPIGVLWGYGSRQELASAGADVFCSSPERLPYCISQ